MGSSRKSAESSIVKASSSAKVATPKDRSTPRRTRNNPPSLMSSSVSSSSTSSKDIISPCNKSPPDSSLKEAKKSKCCVCAKPEEEINQFIRCSDCQRTYHQFCHFVPVIVIPRQFNKWLCLMCKYKDQMKALGIDCSTKQVYKSCSRPIKNQRTFEKSANFRFEQTSAAIKHDELKYTLKSVKGSLSGCLGNIRCHQHTAQIYTDSLTRKANRDSKDDIPLELIESYEKISLNKTRCRDILDSLQNYILSHRPHEPRIGGKTVTCSICYSSESSKDNKILKCDNESCGRAFHMKCNSPQVTQYELDNDPDKTWFCSYCTAFANLIYYVQVEYEGDEEQIDEEWEDVEDVFVEADNEIALAKKMRKAMNMGEGVGYVWNELIEGEEVKEESDNGNSDEDEEDEDFDPDKVIDLEENSGNDSEDDISIRSNVSLGDLSSIYSLSDDEIDTLHSQSKQNIKKKDKDKQILDEKNIVKGKRIRTKVDYRKLNDKAFSDEDSTKNKKKEKDNGNLDEENIIKSKRKRAKVDYRKLNDEMFCDIDSKEIDDEEDYNQNKKSKKPEKKNKGKGVFSIDLIIVYLA